MKVNDLWDFGDLSECQLKPEKANLNRNCVTSSLPEIGTGNGMEKPGKTWQELQLYRQLTRFGMKKSCGRFDCVGLLRFTYRQTALHKVILQP